MKNLKIETQKAQTFDEDNFLPHEGCHCCYDFDKDRYYIVTNSKRILVISIETGKKIVDQKIVSKHDEATPIGIVYSSVNEEIYVAFEEGFVICFTHVTETILEGEEIAIFPCGLHDINLSPDHEVVILVTKNNVVMTLSSNFDILKEVNLMSVDFGEKQFITVGWGKKETQFHGSEGKTAAKAKVDIVHGTTADSGLPKITWKGDGTLFAVSYFDKNAHGRRFKVFNREGVVQYTSELVDCLEENLSWKPSGNLIAATRKLPNKYAVVLFEKNGLLHREFVLPFGSKNVKVIDLVWSRDSDILSVWYKDIDIGEMTVQLWAEKNYHWYLKQTLSYTKINPILFVTWCPSNDKDLLILSSMNSTVYTFFWTVSHSQGKEITDKAVIGVIDGDKVLTTCFKDGIVPPPMAQQTLRFNDPVNAVTFAPKNYIEGCEINSNHFLVLLSNNKLILCKNKNESWESQYVNTKTYNIDFGFKNAHKYSRHLIQHLFWYKPNIILCSLSLGVKSSLYELQLLDIDILDEILIDAKLVHEMPGQIEHIIASSDSSTAYIVVNNKVYSYNDRDGISKTELKISNENLTRAAIKVEFVMFDTKEVILALTRKFVLYVDGKQVANNISSFFVHSEFLLVTTLQHALICFKLNETGLNQLCHRNLTIQSWENHSNELKNTQELNIRRMERGSTLVIVVPKCAKTIVQMPRGNLECVQPRVLSLAIIGSLIDSLDYLKAFDIMRKERIDLNILYDHNPELFINNAEKFLNDIKNPNWLSLFLSDLKNEDVTRTTYASSYENRESSKDISRKIDTICELLMKIMEKNSREFVQPILICLVKTQREVGLEKALLKIKEMQSREHEGTEVFSTDEALKYLLYMVDVNVLFDVALGTYDFDLVMLVAQKSQKDPKEYISFLNNLKKLEENYMKYTIDKHLKRYNSALEYIAKIPEKFDECMVFIQTHGLFSKGIKLFRNKSTEYKKVTEAYAKYLLSKTKYREAGIMYTKAENFQEALFAFKLACCWQDAIVTAIKLNLSANQLNGLYEDLVKRLLQDKRYEEAAVILSKRLNRYADAIATLCEGRHWHQAWTDAYCMNREDLIETMVKPGIKDHAEFMLSQIREHKENFHKYKNRLIVVREKATSSALIKSEFDFEDDPNRDGIQRDFSDLISDTTSIAGSTVTRTSQASHTTGRTYRSSKNRRKHQRKLQSIKEGGMYEDLALIRTLHDLVSRTYQQRDEVRNISEMLLFINRDELAEELYDLMNEFLDDIFKGKREIWPSVFENKNFDSDDPSSTSTNQPFPTGSAPNLLEPHLLQAPEEKSSNWKLDMFSIL